MTRLGTSDQEVERASEREQLVGQRSSLAAAGQHERLADRRSAARRKAGDVFLRTLDPERRNDADQIEGLRSFQQMLNEHYRGQ